jgi:ATP-dependent helicase/DNAse subunit B
VISLQNAGPLYKGADNNAVESNIQLILGSYRSGKTDLILNALLKHCKDHTLSETIVVVPSERYKSLLKKRILKLSKKNREQEQDGSSIISGIIGLRLLTFYQYCRLLLNRAGVFPRIVPDSVRPRIIQMLLEDARDNQAIASLAKVVRNPGAPQAILDLIDELQRAALSPKEVTARLERTAGYDAPQLAHAFLYDQYWQTLDRIDYLDEHRLAYKILELSSAEQLSRAPALVAFDGFDRFNPLQLQVIATSARLFEQIVISFDYLPAENDKKGEYEWKRKTYQQLITYLQPREALQPSRAVGQATLQVFSSGDRYLEMCQIAALVKEAIVNRGVSREEILVVIPRATVYAEAAEAAFYDAGIDCFIDAPIKLAALPIVRFLLTLFSLRENDFARAAVISCLQNPYFKPQELKLTARDVIRLDAISYKQKIIDSEKQWISALENEPFDLKDKMERLFRIFDDAPQFGSAYGFVVWIEDLLDKLMILPDQESMSDSFQLWQVREAVAQVRSCLAALLADENVLAALGQKTDQKYKVHLDKLKNLIEMSNFPRPSLTKESVLICTGEKAPNRSYDEVYIAGLVEGEFPGRSIRGGLLTSDEVSTWESHGVELHNPRFEPGFEIALLTGLKERARKKIVMSTPRFNMDGEELTPAFFFTEQTDNGNASVLNNDYFQNQHCRPVSARSALAASAWCEDNGGEDHEGFGRPSRHPLISELTDNLSEARLVARARDQNDLESPYNGCLKEQTGAGLLKIGMPEFFSASQLGSFGSCPHQYWLSHVIKAKVLEEPEVGLDNRERGSAYHKALELFYGKLITTNKAITDLSETELDALADASLSQCLSDLENAPTFRGGEFWHYQKQELAFRLKQFLRAERDSAHESTEKFKPLAVEATFGYNEQAPPLKISAGQTSILIRGRIDRIDEAIGIAPGNIRRLRVIDYKTGQNNISAKDQKRGIDLQLPLYALAAQRSIFTGSKVVRGEYLSIHGRRLVGNLFPRRRDGESDTNPLDTCEQNVSEFVQKIEQGKFIVAPTTQAECKYCDHRTICRVGELTKEIKDYDESY